MNHKSRIFGIVLGLGLISGTALADGPHDGGHNGRGRGRGVERGVTLPELEQRELARVLADFKRDDLDWDGRLSLREQRAGKGDWSGWDVERGASVQVVRGRRARGRGVSFLTEREVRTESAERTERAFRGADADRNGVLNAREMLAFARLVRV